MAAKSRRRDIDLMKLCVLRRGRVASSPLVLCHVPAALTPLCLRAVHRMMSDYKVDVLGDDYEFEVVIAGPEDSTWPSWPR